MLTALDEKGKILSLAEKWDKSDLFQLRKKQRFYCPICKQQVDLKLGERRQWHFAHTKETCSYESEPESIYHREGKLQLHVWLKSQPHCKTWLEPYLSSIHQRPDVFLQLHNRYYAIEYQCSSLHETLFLKRTTTYLRHSIVPIWILGGNRLRRKSTNTFLLYPFEWLCSYTSFSYPTLIYYCSSTKQISVLSGMVSCSTQKVLATVLFEQLEQMSVPQLLSPLENTPIFSAWLDQKKHWRYQVRPFKSKTQVYFELFCMKRTCSSFLFPIEAGWPTPNLHWIETPPYIWQSWVLLESIMSQPKHSPFHFETIAHTFQTMVNNDIFFVRPIILQKGNYKIALKSYVEFLVKIGLLQMKNEKYYRIQDVTLPCSIEEANKLDANLYTLHFESLNKF
ncbi:competence protein CoiA [Alkalihalobacterium bogoriense]|uniref:competence protein CoiA n=1 Tax=Alkalihalobacterium bogoriense TaxID=246272 RepID=UPI0005563453|nr:competence protein CoiA family protein [Alkalihalobacterium bogoriense]